MVYLQIHISILFNLMIVFLRFLGRHQLCFKCSYFNCNNSDEVILNELQVLGVSIYTYKMITINNKRAIIYCTK